MMRRARRRNGARGRAGTRGILLLEVLSAFAVFAFSSVVLIGVVRRATDVTTRELVRQEGADIAWSAMAKLESGLESTLSISGPVRPWVNPTIGIEGFDESFVDESAWEIEVETTPSGFPGLTLVEVIAIRVTPDGEELSRATARQLLRLEGTRAEDEGLGEVDDLQRAIDRAERRGGSRGRSSSSEEAGGTP